MSFMSSETLVFVEDLDAAVAFYRDKVGLPLRQREEWGLARFELPGGCRLCVLTTSYWDAGEEHISRRRMSIRTDDIETEVARLCATGVDVDDIRDNAGPPRAACFRDADGNEFFFWEDPGDAVGPATNGGMSQPKGRMFPSVRLLSGMSGPPAPRLHRRATGEDSQGSRRLQPAVSATNSLPLLLGPSLEGERREQGCPEGRVGQHD